jgi:hypothetical protein
MTRILCVIALALSLGGCLASFQAKTPSQRVFAAKADYIVPLRAATAYESLPRCANGAKLTEACSRPVVVDIIRRADKAADAALDSAELVVRDPNQSQETLALAASAAEQAVKVFRKILTDNGVLK